MFRYHSNFFLIVLTFFLSCEYPNELQRDNVHDPKSDRYIPDPPTELKIFIEDSKVKLAWSDNAFAEDGYIVEKALGDSGIFSQVGQLPANTGAFIDSTKDLDFTTTYRVTAFKLSGTEMRKSGSISATQQFQIRDVQAKIIDDRQMALSWKFDIHFESGFEIERRVGSGTFEKIAAVPQNSEAFTDEFALNTDTKYTYRVRAVKGDSKSQYAVSNTEILVLVKPADLQMASDSADSLQITWKGRYDFTEFVVERSVNNTSNFVEIGRSNENRFTDTDLNIARSYRYRVKEVTASHQSPYSNVLSVKYQFFLTAKEIFNVNTITHVLAYSPDGQKLAGVTVGQINIWNGSTGRTQQFFLPDEDKNVRSLSFHPNGEILAGGATNVVYIWDVSSGSTIEKLHFQSLGTQVGFSPAGDNLIIATNHDSTRTVAANIHVWDVNSRMMIRSWKAEGDIYSLAVSPDRSTVVTSHLRIINFWDVNNGSLQMQLGSTPFPVFYRSLTYNAPGNYLVAGSSGEIFLWDLTTNTLKHRLQVPQRPVSVFFTRNDVYLGAGVQTTNIVRFWDLATGALRNGVDLGRNTFIISGAYSPALNILAMSERDGSGLTGLIKLYEVNLAWREEE
jgi:WD40 repeat protein